MRQVKHDNARVGILEKYEIFGIFIEDTKCIVECNNEGIINVCIGEFKNAFSKDRLAAAVKNAFNFGSVKALPLVFFSEDNTCENGLKIYPIRDENDKIVFGIEIVERSEFIPVEQGLKL